MATGNRNVICIPSKPCRTLSEAVKYYICAPVPGGRILGGIVALIAFLL